VTFLNLTPTVMQAVFNRNRLDAGKGRKIFSERCAVIVIVEYEDSQAISRSRHTADCLNGCLTLSSSEAWLQRVGAMKSAQPIGASMRAAAARCTIAQFR
jgi:hypothetical protein